MFGWLKRRRLSAAAAEFLRRAAANDHAGAVAVYRAQILADEHYVGKDLRAAYHLASWCGDREPDHVRQLDLLAADEPDGSDIREAAALAHRLWRASGTAAALDRNDPARAAAPPADVDPHDAAVHRVGMALLEAGRANTPNATPADRRAAAERVMRLLPLDAPLDGTTARVRAHLLVWAAQMVDEPHQILSHRSLLAALPGPLADTCNRAAAFGHIRRLLAAGQVQKAAGVLNRGANSPTIPAILLAVGGSALATPDVAAEWFAQLLNSPGPHDTAEWLAAVRVGLAVARFRAGQFAQGRAGLADLAASPLRPLALYLTAVSHLAELRAGLGDGGGVRTRALWQAARDRILPTLADLEATGPEWGWRAHMLRGLMAFLDTRDTLDPASIERFAAAAGRLAEPNARTRLKAVEGALLARARATEEAVELIRRRDVAGLRAFNAEVLEPLGDALPPFVRVAVLVTIWQADPTFDPLPGIERVPLTQPEEVELVTRAASEVRTAQAVRRLRQECLRTGTTGEVPPAPSQFAADQPALARLAHLAVAVIHLKRKNTPAAGESLRAIGPPGELARPTAVARFYHGWVSADLPACQAVVKEHPRDLPPAAAPAAAARALLDALERTSPDVPKLFLALDDGTLESPTLPAKLLPLVVWLLDHGRPQPALALLTQLRGRGLTNPDAVADQVRHLSWLCMVLEVMVVARLGQFAKAGELADRALTAKQPAKSAFGDGKATKQVLGWVRLVRLGAELGAAANSGGELRGRWREVRESLDAKAAELENVPGLQHYAALAAGLIAGADPNAAVDDAVVGKLDEAQRSLPFGRTAGAVERAVAGLRWRQQVVDKFWQLIRSQQLGPARQLYAEHLEPTYRDRAPPALEFARLVLDTEAGDVPADELHRRAQVLQSRAAAELSPDLFARYHARRADADGLRRLAKLIRDRDFEQVYQAAVSSTWDGVPAGSHPPAVAVASLLAGLKTRRTDEVVRVAGQVRGRGGANGWTENAAGLILGYALYSDEKFPPAAEAFRSVPPHTGGHDTERYWAAAQFSDGMQLLGVNQKEKAFEAFSRALTVRGRPADGSLAPLFLHFGLTAVNNKQGNRAKRAFELAAESGRAAKASPQAALHVFLADLGLLLCRALTDADVTELKGEAFLALAPRVATLNLPPETAKGVERVLAVSAACQELRRQVRLEAKARTKPAALQTELRKYADEIEKHGEAVDAVLFTLRGVADLLLQSGDHSAAALDSITRALRLGVQSHKLVALFEKHKGLMQEARKRQSDVMDLFDAYLINGSVPAAHRERLSGVDELTALYRLNRGYAPDAVIAADVEAGVTAVCKRTEDLIAAVESGPLATDPGVKAASANARTLIAALRKSEGELLAVERGLLESLARQLRSHSFTPDQDRP